MLSAPTLAVALAAGVGALYFGLRAMLQRSPVADQYAELTARDQVLDAPGADAPLIIRLLGGLGARLQRGPAGQLLDQVDSRRLKGLELKLHQAGNPWGITARDLIAMQVGGAVAGTAAAVWFATLAGYDWMWGLPIGVLVALVPRSRISEISRKRTTAILTQLPNFLDLLLVNARAGQPLQRGFELAGEKLEGPLAVELRHVTALMRVGEPEDRALLQLAERTGLDEMHRLASALITALRYGGAGFTDSLQLLANQVRTEWRQSIQTQIERTKVWLWFPLTLCLIPAFVLLLVGPAVVQIVTEL